MTATRLEAQWIEKPWGRRDLPPEFGAVEPGNAPVGEIWFEDPRGDGADLLVKYLFTSEKLSIQVHPDDAMARAVGHPSGKEEVWVVLAAEPGAVIGLGFSTPVTHEELRAAALDGRIENMLDWRPAKAGQVIYVPPGTVHALGAGLTLIEVQQNVDLTYRLYDYGRGREMHLDAGIAAALPDCYRTMLSPYALDPGRHILVHDRAFVLERLTGARAGQLMASQPVWLVPLCGSAAVDEAPMIPGTVWLAEGETEIDLAEDAELLIAYPGAEAKRDLI